MIVGEPELTVSVATWLVTWPALLLTTTLYCPACVTVMDGASTPKMTTPFPLHK